MTWAAHVAHQVNSRNTIAGEHMSQPASMTITHHVRPDDHFPFGTKLSTLFTRQGAFFAEWLSWGEIDKGKTRMAETSFIEEPAAYAEDGEQLNGDQLAQTAWHIGEEARWLQEIAERDNLDFLSYLLRLVVLETEMTAAKSELTEQQPKDSDDSKPRLIE